MKIHPVEAELLHEEGHDEANAPKKRPQPAAIHCLQFTTDVNVRPFDLRGQQRLS